MVRIIFFTILSFLSFNSFCQERNDGYFIVHLMETNSEDLKCEVGVNSTYISSLMENGRHVISAVPTKFGTIVLHEKAQPGINQKYIDIPSYNLKKVAKEQFKNGYILENYNDMSDYAIFVKNTNNTKQVFLGQPNQKKIAKQNKKGIYVKLGSKIDATGHNIFEKISTQERKFYVFQKNFVSDFQKMAEAGYILGSATTSYNKYNNKTSFTVIYDKPQTPYTGRQLIGIFETKDKFVAFLKKHVKGNFNIKGIYGGWENRNYAADEALAQASPKESALDILLGLGNSIMQLKSASKSQSNSSDSSNESTSTTNSPNKSKSKVGKCQTCGGTGSCTAKTAAGRKGACSGSGLCGYCNGTGWIKAGASETICTACNGKGKCKTCHGTGKCKKCGGTGK